MLGDVVVERLAALHLAHDRRAGRLLEHATRKEREQPVSPLHLAVAIDHAHAVGIAIEAHCEVAAVGLHIMRHDLHRLNRGRVGVVVGEAAVRLDEPAHRLHAQPRCKLQRQRTADAISAIDEHLERPRAHRDARGNMVQVALLNLEPLQRAGADHELLRHHAPVEPLHAVAMHRVAAQEHLEAVELRRVVRPGDLHAAAQVVEEDGKVEDGRRDHAHIEHAQAGRRKAADQRRLNPRTGEPAVSAYREGGRTSRHSLAAERTT